MINESIFLPLPKVFLIFFLMLLTLGGAHGKTYKMDQGAYTGSVRSGVPHGNGTMKFKNGNVYSGEWKVGRADGIGKLTRQDGSYVDGGWKKGKLNGSVIMVSSDGVRSEGTWKNGKIHGFYRKTFIDGSYYTGTWIKGVLDGDATYHFANGDTFVGKITDDKPNGKGVYTHLDTGMKHSGGWKDGLKHGQFTSFFPDGSRYSGKWADGEPVTTGIHISEEGESYYGEFSAKRKPESEDTSLAVASSSRGKLTEYGRQKTEKLRSQIFTTSPADTGISRVTTKQERASKNVPENNMATSGCEEYSFDLMFSMDSAWNELDFSVKAGESYCVR